jgi:hypothetical protein
MVASAEIASSRSRTANVVPSAKCIGTAARNAKGKRWKIHKAFCKLKCRRDDEEQSRFKNHLNENPSIREDMQKGSMSKVWDGKEDNNYFENTLALLKSTCGKVYMAAELQAKIWTSLPPTVARAHGPLELWKLASYVMNQCEATDYIHEQKAWLSVLEYLFHPHWPESEAQPETLFLRANVEAFVEHGGLSRLFESC